jgi:sulfatase modifying factor 1
MGNSVVCQGESCGHHPQVCVDWCDAFAYCKGVGKRLCGKIGGGEYGYKKGVVAGGPLDDDSASATLSQWFNACSSGGKNAFPYGATFDGRQCNAIDKGVDTTVPVGSLPGCQSSVSGYAGVYDLSGNLQEWEDSCNGTTGDQDKCRVRGGAFLGRVDTFLRCNYGLHTNRGSGNGGTGFRCCSDP